MGCRDAYLKLLDRKNVAEVTASLAAVETFIAKLYFDQGRSAEAIATAEVASRRFASIEGTAVDTVPVRNGHVFNARTLAILYREAGRKPDIRPRDHVRHLASATTRGRSPGRAFTSHLSLPVSRLSRPGGLGAGPPSGVARILRGDRATDRAVAGPRP